MTCIETTTSAGSTNRSVRPGLALSIVALVQFLVSLDLAIVNVALPRIGAALDFTPVGLTWVINAYALTFGGLLLLGGKAADRYGRKPVLVLGIALFGLASLAGGLAHTSAELIIARAVQGVGAATLAPAALSLLSATFPAGRPRIRAFGVWSAVNAAGGAFGVLAGGMLTEYLGWRWVMFVNVPMVAVALALGVRGIADDKSDARRADRPDVLGAFVGTAGVTLLVFAVVRTNQYAWTSSVTIATLALSVALLGLFVHVERTARDPLLRIGLLTNRSVACANTYNLLLGAAIASALYFITLYLQRVLGAGAAATGLMLLPFALAVIVGSIVAVKLGPRLGFPNLLIAGGLLAALGFGWYGQISAGGSYLADVLGPELLVSLGYGLCLGPIASMATIGVALRESGTASGLLNTSRQLGAALGLAVLGTAAYDRTGPSATRKALAAGYALGLSIDAALLVAAVLVAVSILRRFVR